MRFPALFLILALFVLLACNRANQAPDEGPKTNGGLNFVFEKYRLDNGLEVVLHVDRSDPIVATAIQYHVGSAREKKGRTGFAHLFEHLLFKATENVSNGQLDQMVIGAGGPTPNGYTNNDETVYMELVPKNNLEMMLWLDSDRMGYFINMLDEQIFAVEQEIVQNEKRQNVDNRPYGHTRYVINQAVFPEEHPYHWQVIGELVDLQNATVDDVKEFYGAYYGPNNATLVIAGDIDVAQTKEWVQKYFGEIKPIGEVAALSPPPVKLETTRKLYHEDQFARVPELTLTWPTVKARHADATALDFLGNILAGHKESPIYKVLVIEEKLAANPRANQRGLEHSGTFSISVRALAGKNLTEVDSALTQALARFAEKGPGPNDMERVKAGLETAFYNRMGSVMNRAVAMASNNGFTGNPAYYQTELEAMAAVTREDVIRVFERYIHGRVHVITSFVPKGALDLVVEGSEKARVVEEVIKPDQGIAVNETKKVKSARTKATFDRSKVPASGPNPALSPPTPWRVEAANGMTLLGIEQGELPLVSFRITMHGGQLLEEPAQAGVANLTAEMMMEGTAAKTPAQLEEAIALLGAQIRITASQEGFEIGVNVLSRNFEKTVDLVTEILLQPRWDIAELPRVKDATINNIRQLEANARSIATRVFNRKLYGAAHPFARALEGSTDSVKALGIEALQAFYAKQVTPSVAAFLVVGNVDQARVKAALARLEADWPARDLVIPSPRANPEQQTTSLYFVDRPGAKQSMLFVGHLGPAYTDEAYYPASVMNHHLGADFTSVLNQILREQKGYTYGVRSGFFGSRLEGTFSVRCGVRSNATSDAVKIIKDSLAIYREGISEEDLEATRNTLIRSNARRFETLGALLGMMNNIHRFALPDNYLSQQESIVAQMSVGQHGELAKAHIRPNEMIYVVVGDAASQLEGLARIGLGKPVLLTVQGDPVE